MTEHYCKFVIKLQPRDMGVEGTFSMEYEECGKVAHFKDDLDSWWCADHWDERQELFKAAMPYESGQGVCRICNCEFYDGECNCQFYQFG